MMEKHRILFVDDEPNVLQGLKRLLRSHRNEWDMEFTTSGKEALELLKQKPFQIIVSDLRMPEINGAQLLSEVKQRYPDMARFILSGHADTDMILQSVSSAHQFLAKPCDADLLQEAIARAITLHELFQSSALIDIVKDASSLPALPDLYQQLTEALRSSSSSSETIAEIISKDITMSAKILQLVNSAFFGLSRKVDSISQAVSLLGVETINSVALTAGVFEKFDQAIVEKYAIREIYAHSIRVSKGAANLMKAVTRDKKKTEEAMLAGLIHDIGKLAMIHRGNEEWSEIYLHRADLGKPLHEVEKERLGICHTEVGAYLLGLWGLSNHVAEAVAFYQRPSLAPSREFGTLAALHIADILERQSRNASGRLDYDMTYLNEVGIADKLEEYKELCDLPATEQ